jgi:hypothetical protein
MTFIKSSKNKILVPRSRIPIPGPSDTSSILFNQFNIDLTALSILENQFDVSILAAAPTYGFTAKNTYTKGYTPLNPASATYPDINSPYPGITIPWTALGTNAQIYTGTPQPLLIANYVEPPNMPGGFRGPNPVQGLTKNEPRTVAVRCYSDGPHPWYNGVFNGIIYIPNIGNDGFGRSIGWRQYLTVNPWYNPGLQIIDGNGNAEGTISVPFDQPGIITVVFRQTSTNFSFGTTVSASTYTESYVPTGTISYIQGPSGFSYYWRYFGCLIWETADYIDDDSITYWADQYMPGW